MSDIAIYCVVLNECPALYIVFEDGFFYLYYYVINNIKMIKQFFTRYSWFILFSDLKVNGDISINKIHYLSYEVY